MREIVLHDQPTALEGRPDVSNASSVARHYNPHRTENVTERRCSGRRRRCRSRSVAMTISGAAGDLAWATALAAYAAARAAARAVSRAEAWAAIAEARALPTFISPRAQASPASTTLRGRLSSGRSSSKGGSAQCSRRPRAPAPCGPARRALSLLTSLQALDAWIIENLRARPEDRAPGGSGLDRQVVRRVGEVRAGEGVVAGHEPPAPLRPRAGLLRGLREPRPELVQERGTLAVGDHL